MATLVAVSQIIVLIFVSFFTGFGRSPYAFTPTAIAINIAFFLSALVGLEFSRTYLIKSFPKTKIFLGLGLMALFYTLISLQPTKFLTLGSPVKTVMFLGSDFLPTLAQSLLATFLALVGGPAASIAYLGTLEAFEWLSPILPNPAWPIKALITTLIPTIGFFVINETVSSSILMRFGLLSKSEADDKLKPKAKKYSSLTWIVIGIIGVVLVWGATGLLGFQPSIIASGSMSPSLEVGDIAITVPTPPENIVSGDVIQFWRAGDPAPIIHRVTEIYDSGGATVIVTKGDANNAPDDPITTTKPINKLVLTIPKLGWIPIYARQILSNVTYLIIAAASVSLLYVSYIYRNKILGMIKR